MLLLSPVLITPWWSFDAVNVPRFAILVVISGFCLPILLLDFARKTRDKVTKKDQKVLYLFVLLQISILMPIIGSKSSLQDQMFGAPGRWSGGLTLVSLLIVFAYSYQINSALRDSLLNKILWFGGLGNLAYASIQALDKDPINWQNQYGPVIGFMGNPNFLSAYLGFFTVLIISQIQFSVDKNWPRNIFKTLMLIWSVYILILTDSIQGLVILCGGIFIIFAIKLYYTQKSLFKIFIMSGSLFSMFIFASFIGLGPLGDLLKQSTLLTRLEFWNAAWKIFLDFPFFGVGLDQYGNWYPAYRSPGIVNSYGPDLYTNSAHNVFLDKAAQGGILLFGSYILLHIVIIVGVFARLSKGPLNSFDVALIAMSFGFVLHEFISVNTLTLSIFGHALFGLVLGKLSKLDYEDSKAKMNNSKLNLVRSRTSILQVVTAFMALWLIFPVVKNDLNFRAAILSKDGNRILKVAKAKPFNESHVLLSASIFYDNGYTKIANSILQEYLEQNKRSYRSLEMLLARNTELREQEKYDLRLELFKLDPLNPASR